MQSVNWGQLVKDAGDVAPVPVGKYDAIITSAELKQSGSGRDYWAVRFRIQSGPHTGRTLYNNFVLVPDNPNALRAFFINMQNLGITQDQIVQLGTDLNALTPLLVGRQAILTVTHREYQGTMRDNVDRVEKHPAGPMGNLAAAAAPAAGGTPVPAAAPVPQAAPVPVAAPAPAAVAPVPAAQPVAPAVVPQPVAVPPTPEAQPAAQPVAAAPVVDTPAVLDPTLQAAAQPAQEAVAPQQAAVPAPPAIPF